MSNLTTAWMLGCVCGFFLGVTAQGWRRRSTCRELMRERHPTFASFSHENTNQPSGPPPLKLRRSDPVRMDEGRTQRGNGSSGPPVGPPSDVAAAINSQLDRDIAIARRKRGLSPYGWGPRQLNPPPPAPGMRREYIWSPTQMAECGGPCWEAQDPRCCDCGAMWRDVPIRMDEGRTQRGNGSGGTTTPKSPIKPQPSGGRLITNNKLTEDT